MEVRTGLFCSTALLNLLRHKQKKLLVTMMAVAAVFGLASFIIWPRLDVIISGWFYVPGKNFVFADQPLFLFLHWLAYYGARALGAVLVFLVIATWWLQRPLGNITRKGWLFLLFGLLLAPGLIGNVMLKDHWGRARPREILEFGGTASFSPALVPQTVTHTNGSFVSGDAAFGFFLPAFAYVVPRRLSRRFFWGGMGAGGFFGLARLAMGAHFMSDILYAAILMLSVMAALFVLMFGAKNARLCWRSWLLLERP